MTPRFDLLTGAGALSGLGEAWDRLAERTPSPFLTREWTAAWCEAFGERAPRVATLRAGDGELLAAAVLRPVRAGLAATANDHSGDWDAVARDDEARAELWCAIGRLRRPRLVLTGLREPGAAVAARELRREGYRVVPSVEAESPFLRLPGSFDELLAGRSANLRSQWRRRRRALDREGTVAVRCTTAAGPRLERDLDALFAIEASGWKGRAGTAIASDPATTRLYGDFARAAAGRGWLRVYVLEVDGRPLAADLGCAMGGVGFLLKTGFDDAAAALSPGLVLRGEVLRASIEEGLTGYDFLGGPDAYKTRWTGDVRVRARLEAYRGTAAVAAGAYRRVLRPAAGRARRWAAARRG